MSIRFKLLSAIYLVLVMLLTDHSGDGLLGGIGDVFIGLGSLLVFAVIALWPTSSERAEKPVLGGNWADRIDFDQLPRADKPAP